MKKFHGSKAFNALTAAALGISLSAGGALPALAETPASNAAVSSGIVATFPDVPEGHWARSHVAKLAASQIVRGYSDGTYAPNKNVTQQEAIVMAIRMIGLEDEVKAINHDFVLGGIEVDALFRPYVYVALKERILNLAEETQAGDSGNNGLSWGKRPASREWLAKLIVRAVGKGENAASAGSPPFADADKISPDAAGYVRIAADLGIVTGFKEDNTFRPGGTVTRAQIAAFLSRAEQYIPEQSGRAASGYVTAVSGGTLQLRTEDNRTKTFALHTNTLVFKATGQAATAADLQTNQKVKLVHQNNTAYYIEIVNDTVQLETFEGKLTDLNVSEMNVTLTGASGVSQYKLASDVTVVNEQGDGMKLSDITKESTVRLQRLPGSSEITRLTVLKLAFNKSGEGVVEAIDAANRKITVKPVGGASAETYPVSANAQLQLNGRPLDGLNGIQAGDTVSYEVLDSTVVSVNILKQRYVTLTGELFNFADDNITVLENGNELKAYFLVKDVNVEIDGLEDAALNDLQKGDSVQLKIRGSDNKVESITVLNRNITKIKQATVIHFDGTRKFITVLNDKDKPLLFEITDRTQIMLDGSPMPAQLYPLYLAENRKVNVTVTENRLVRLDVVTYVDGKVTGLNAATRSITVTTAANEKITLPYSSVTTVIVPKKLGASIADIAAGTQVRLHMDTQSTVTQIHVKKSFVYTLISVDAAARKLTVRDGQNSSGTIYLETGTALLNAEGNAMSLSALKTDEPVVATYMGNTLQSVTSPRAVRGKITSFDSMTGKLIVTDFNNNAREFNVADGANIQYNGTVSSNLSAMKVNDRVQVVVDGTGTPYVWVANGMERTFSSYNSQRNEISFKIATLSEQSVYGIHPFAYLHSADGGVLALNRLKEGDKLTVFVLEGKIIELIK